MLISPHQEDHTSARSIFRGSIWTLRLADSFQGGCRILRTVPVQAVISESRFADGRCWKDLLHRIQAMGNPPPLIVADRLADEALWAEVLNLGGYDLLWKPFRAGEVLNSVRMACGASDRMGDQSVKFQQVRPAGS